MEIENGTITFTLVFRDEVYRVQTSRDQYHSLLTLISVRLSINGFGICCGMGSCGTCMVEIHEKYSGEKRITLSCDVQINEDLANAIINIPAIC